MTIIRYPEIRPNLLSYSDFHLAVKSTNKLISITMSMQKPYFYTNYFPMTYDILESGLPELLRAICFNDSDLPFNTEVKNTEMGHLFEHIILEYMCELKIKSGYQKASFKGVTNWNWKKDTKGTFHIEIGIGQEDLEFFEIALQKSIVLLNKILVSETVSLSN
jgi:hypothetical protein